MIRSLLRGAAPASALAVALCLAPPVASQAAPRPADYAVQGVRIERAEDGRSATLILRGGRVDAVLAADAELPRGVRVVDGSGLLALPAFVDAYTRTGCETPQPAKDRDRPVDVRSDVRIDMRTANRKGIQPSFQAVDVVTLDEGAVKSWTEGGFGALLSAPGGQLLGGTSALVAVRDAASRELVLTPIAHAHAAFQANGPGYPTTLMGYHAQLRQFFHDARRHGELQRRLAAGKPTARPPYDEELTAGGELVDGERLLVCEAETARDIERWFDLADEFGLRIAISGGRDAWMVAAELKSRGVPVFLTLDWGDEVDDPDADAKKKGEESEEEPEPEASDEEKPDESEEPQEETWLYEEPLDVQRERRARWEQRRDCAIRLHEAGVTFAFGTGSSKPKELLGNVRALIEAGLPADVALAGLTGAAASLVGADRRLGALEQGMDATLVLWTADPLVDKAAEPAWIFVDGFATEREIEPKNKGGEGPAEGVDLTGSWNVAISGGEDAPESAALDLTMAKDGTLTGSYEMEVAGGMQIESSVEGEVSGTDVTLRGTFQVAEQDISFEVNATVDGDRMEGETETRLPWLDNPEKSDFEANRDPESEGGRS
ncbi:MAG: hypothetical protein AAF682_03430 [Planctomycetota bacterium]